MHNIIEMQCFYIVEADWQWTDYKRKKIKQCLHFRQKYIDPYSNYPLASR